jgi:hypothetical protein
MRPEQIPTTDPLYPYLNGSPFEKLKNILTTRTIYATTIPFLPNNPKAVCFTECVWDALIQLSEFYSPYGVVFSKKIVFDKGGGPVLYVRGDHLSALKTSGTIPTSLESFIQPFDPKAVLRRGTPIDFIHEREWRLPLSLIFEYKDLEYVLVQSIAEATTLVKAIGSGHLPEKKIIPLGIYEEIRKAWGKE